MLSIDINDIRSLVLVAAFFGFIGVWIWAWRKERKTDFDESANLPLEEDTPASDGYSTNNSWEKP
ncbi:MAG: cbb3-type cytochrome c oxidase subunit 3 [Pseudomonadota bacterium]